MVLKQQFSQAASYFNSPSGPLPAGEIERIASELRRIVAATGASGNPEPVTRQPTSGKSVRFEASVATAHRNATLFEATTYAVSSQKVPGLLLRVITKRNAPECSVLSVQLLTHDAEGIQVLTAHK